MASRTAIISTNCGGLPEVNINAKTGFLSDVGDYKKMSKDTLSLLSNPKKLEEFKNNALEHAKTFDIPNILPSYELLYKELYSKIER